MSHRFWSSFFFAAVVSIVALSAVAAGALAVTAVRFALHPVVRLHVESVGSTVAEDIARRREAIRRLTGVEVYPQRDNFIQQKTQE